MSTQHDESIVNLESTDVTIFGVHVKSEGYPNVTFRVRGLGRVPLLRTREINFPFRAMPTHLGSRKRRWGALKWIWAAFRLTYAHLRLLLAYFWHGRPNNLYIPYPSAIVLFCLSLLPKLWRPANIVADCFISLYDTTVTDRRLISPESWLARALKSLESRAYRIANVVVVDTDLNANYFTKTFGLAPSKVSALPLSIDESVFQPAAYLPSGDSCTILFVGTFVPLQGVDVIAQAAVMLEKCRNLRFRLIGSGQTAEAVEHIFSTERPTNVEWITQWMNSECLADEIRRADICLGIFGTGLKSQRVWPLKNYAYMAIGRPIITGDTLLARHMLQKTGSAPFLTVPGGNPEALAKAIVDLALNPGRREDYAINARLFYDENLDSRIALAQLVTKLVRTSDKSS